MITNTLRATQMAFQSLFKWIRCLADIPDLASSRLTERINGRRVTVSHCSAPGGRHAHRSECLPVCRCSGHSLNPLFMSPCPSHSPSCHEVAVFFYRQVGGTARKLRPIERDIACVS